MDKAQKIEKVQGILDSKEWTVEDILGQGTFGLGVFRAREVLSENYFAVKVVKFNSRVEDRYRRREISLLNKDLSNRNVVRHHHAWRREVGDSTFLCYKMELCLINLCDYMKKNTINKEEGVQSRLIVKDENFYKVVFPQVLNGLDAIHSLYWIHRDISLANILVQLPVPKSIRGIKVKIGGLMLARRLSSQSSDFSDQAELEERWPKPERALYQAPELSSKDYCEKVDLYSAGIVLYLLASYPEEENAWPDDEIRALKEGKRDRSHLCHDHNVLDDLLFSPTRSLLREDPCCRPSAKEALSKLPLQPEHVLIKSGHEKNNILIRTAIAASQNSLELVNDSLGKGSYGRVVSVRHKEDNNLYAVKIIRSSPDNPEKYKKRELAILTRQVDSPKTHDNIVRYYNSWELLVEGEPPTLCIRLELCDKSLDDVLKKGSQYVDQEIFHKHIFKQILAALQYLHDNCWVHRDIYPRNILLKTPVEGEILSWVVKVADFGLARELQRPSLTVSDQRKEALSRDVGNRNYRAPEIETTQTYGCKVDMYSAGLVLYRLCCHFKNDEKTVEALREVKRMEVVNIEALSHTNDVLYELMNDLVKHNPDVRPDASEAKERFSEYIDLKKSALPDLKVSTLSIDDTDATSMPDSKAEAVEHDDVDYIDLK